MTEKEIEKLALQEHKDWIEQVLDEDRKISLSKIKADYNRKQVKFILQNGTQ